MRPFKALNPFSRWLLRLGLLFMAGVLVWPALQMFQFTSLNSLINAAIALFAILLLLGGFLSKHSLTMLSGLALLLLSAWQVYWYYSGINLSLAAWVLTGIVGLHFFINGNK